MLRDIDIIRGNFYRFVPDNIEENVRGYLGMADGVLGGFIRGQILVALCLAVMYSAGLLVSGLRFGVVIGVTAGILSVIPYVGFLIGLLASGVVFTIPGILYLQTQGVNIAMPSVLSYVPPI